MHILQPKHIKLKPEEANILLEKLNITALQLPKIKKDDSALLNIDDIKAGDIIKIERKTHLGKIIYYRIVIA